MSNVLSQFSRTPSGFIRRRIFGLSLEETSFARRGFYAKTTEARLYLEKIGQTFLCGYHHALESKTLPELTARIQQDVPSERLGFAYEGAAMPFTMLDYLTPWRHNRLEAYLEGPGKSHIYLAYIGAGWAAARLKRPLQPLVDRLRPDLAWLVGDGYGFHETYFQATKYAQQQTLPAGLTGYALRAFDQGVGRCLWFVHGTDVQRIADNIRHFAPNRHPDLWSGVGLASAYAGGVTKPELELLRQLAAPYYPQLAQGVAFAAEARRLANNPAEQTELAAQVLCNHSADALAQITADTAPGLPLHGPEPAFEIWRQRIQAKFR